MREGEHNRCLVDILLPRTYLTCGESIGKNEEPGEITLVGLNTTLKYIKSVKPCGIFSAHSGMPHKVITSNLLGTPGSVEPLHNLEIGVTTQVLLTLHKSHRMRVHFSEPVNLLPGKRTQHM